MSEVKRREDENSMQRAPASRTAAYGVWVLLASLLLGSVGACLVAIPLRCTWRQRQLAEAMEKAGLKVLDASGANSLPCIYLPLPPACAADVVEAHVSKDQGLHYLRGFPGLRSLVLTANVTDRGMSRLADVPRLRWLTLNGNKVTDAGLEHLSHTKELRQLTINSPRVSDAGCRHFKYLTYLGVLSLHLQSISDAGLVHLKDLNDLHTLFIRGAEVTGTSLEQLGELSNLEILHLDEVVFGDSSLVGLQGLVQLRHLSLRRSRPVSDDGLVHVKGLTKLQELDLSGTQITDLGLEHLTGLTNLEHLYVYDTQVTEKGIEELQSSLSESSVQIHHDESDR